MTDEEIAAYRAQVREYEFDYERGYATTDALGSYIAVVPALLDEVERLQTTNATMREIVERVAESGALVQDSEYLSWTCGLCDAGAEWFPRLEDGGEAEVVHTPDCPVIKARALLAQTETPQNAEPEPQ